MLLVTIHDRLLSLFVRHEGNFWTFVHANTGCNNSHTQFVVHFRVKGSTDNHSSII
ncbi:hypothetical protein D3C72_2155190 [compost metagenome]